VRLTQHYNAGAEAVLEKLAISGSMYARAAANAAARRGAAMPSSLMQDVAGGRRMVRQGLQAGQPRAAYNPDVSPVARMPGAMMPTQEQKSMQGLLESLHTSSRDVPLTPHQELRNRALLEYTGHQYPRLPGQEEAIRAMAHPRRERIGVPTAAGKQLPHLAPIAFEPTTARGVTNPWGGDATMPEHLSSIPGMPAWAPH
jgi:hypothetical protein